MTRRARRRAGPQAKTGGRARDRTVARRARLVLVITVATAVRLVNLWWMSDHPVTVFQTTWTESDTAIHWAWAGRIRDGDVLSRDAGQADTTWMRAIAPIDVWQRWQGGAGRFTKAPLYPYVLAGLRVLARDDLTGVLVGQLLIGLAGVVLTFLLAERFFGIDAATAAGLCAACYGPALLHETLLVRDGLAATTSLLLLWGLARATADATGRWFVAGVFFALALLARELTMLFAPFAVAWIVQRVRRQPARILVVLASFAGGVVVGLAPLAIRNLAVGVPVLALSALGGHGIVIGHAVDAVPAGFMVPDSAKAIFLEAQGDLGATVRLTLASYHGDWMRLVSNEAARTAAILASFEAGDNVSWYYFANRWPLLRFSLHYDVVLALAVVGLWAARGRAPTDARLLVYFLVAAFVGLQYTSVVTRYRLVPAAVLTVYAGVAIAWLLEVLRARQWKVAGAGVAVAIAVFLLSRSLLPEFATRNRYRPAEFIVASRAYVERKDFAHAYDEMRAGLMSAYAGPAQHVLPEGYLMLANGLVRVGTAIGRTGDVATVMTYLHRTYDADANVAALARAAGVVP